MKKKYLFFLLLFPTLLFAQEQKNILKTNLFSLALNNYNITYERSINKMLSISAGIRFMPTSTAPLKKYIEDYVDQADFEINSFKMGNTAITIEPRIYFGNHKMNGFYLAPYLRYLKYTVDFPITHPQNITSGANNPPIILIGNISAVCGGLMIGAQQHIGKKLVADVCIVGAHYGKSKGTLIAKNITPALKGQDLIDFQQTLDDYKQIGLYRFEGTVYPDGTGAEQKASGPWIGIRTLSFSLGYRF